MGTASTGVGSRRRRGGRARHPKRLHSAHKGGSTPSCYALELTVRALAGAARRLCVLEGRERERAKT